MINFKREHVSWQATCNFVGQAIGSSFGNFFLIVLESPKFSNQYFRPVFGLEPQEHGLVTLKSIYWFRYYFI